MNTKSRYAVIIIFGSIIIFVLGIVIYNAIYHKKITSMTRITNEDEINIIVSNIKIDHGMIFIDSGYYISGPFENSTEEIFSLYEIPAKSHWLKKRNSDTIFIQSDNNIFLTLILK